MKIYSWRKVHFVLGLLARDIANYSYAQNTSLTQALNRLSNKPCEANNIGVLPAFEKCLLDSTLNQDPLGLGLWATAVIVTEIPLEISVCVIDCGGSLCFRITFSNGKRKEISGVGITKP